MKDGLPATQAELDAIIRGAEKRGYGRGYQAGRNKTANEMAKWQAIHDELADARVARRDRFFCAALTGLLAHETNWKMNGEQVKSTDQHVELAKRFAIKAMEVMPHAY